MVDSSYTPNDDGGITIVFEQFGYPGAHPESFEVRYMISLLFHIKYHFEGPGHSCPLNQ